VKFKGKNLRELIGLLFICVTALFFIKGANALDFNDPLIDAADLGQKEKVIELLKSGKSPDTKGDFGVTPLMRAAFRGNAEIIKILLNSGAYVNATDVGGETALHLAARNGNTEVVQLLLSYDAMVDAQDKEKWTPLMRAVMAKKTETASALIAKGANVSVLNSNNESVLTQAATVGKPEIMEMIIGDKNFSKIPEEQKADAIKIADRRGNDSVSKMLAAITPNPEKKVELADLGGDKNAGGLPPIPAPSSPATQTPTKLAIQNPISSVSSGSKTATTGDDFNSWPAEPGKVTGKPTQTASATAPAPAYVTPPPPPAPIPVAPTTLVTPPPPSAAETPAYLKDTPVAKPTEPEAPKVTAAKEEKEKLVKPATAKKGKKDKKIAAKPKAKKALPEKPEDSGTTDYSMQIGAFSNEENAFDSWNGYKKKYKDVFGSFDPEIAPKIYQSTAETVYLLRAGHFNSKKKASASCARLQARNIDCTVVESSPTQYSLTKRPAPKPADLANNDLQAFAPIPSAAPAIASRPVAPTTQPTAPTPVAPVAQPAAPLTTAPKYAPVAPAPADQLPWMKDPNYTPRNNWNLPEAAAQAPAPVAAAPLVEPAPVLPTAPLPDNGAEKQLFNDLVDNKVPDRKEAINDFKNAQAAATTPQAAEPAPHKEQEYNQFYKEIETNKQTPVSEAVLVPDEVYFGNANNTQAQNNAAGIWLEVSPFADKAAADDYANRMFRYDENLSHLQILISERPPVSMRIGPMDDTGPAEELCNTVRAGGLTCSTSGTATAKRPANKQNVKEKDANPFAPATAGQQPEPQASSDTWINLGTFTDTPEAEYYWSFLQEDSGDILSKLKYDISPAKERGSMPSGAVQLRLGPISPKSRAVQICNIMRYRNIACLVQ
jgi:hypothetical protein